MLRCSERVKMQGECLDGGTVSRWRESVKMEGQC